MFRLVKRNFSVQMSLFVVAVIILVSILSATTSYHYIKNRMTGGLAEHLLAVVNSSSWALDGDRHQEIFWDVETGYDDESLFLEFVTILKKIQKVNKMEVKQYHSSLYTLTKSYDFDNSGNLEFVAMSHKNKDGKYFTGYVIKAEPHHLQAFNGSASVTDIYDDSEGVWISAAAPIIDQAGDVVAILQADRTIDFYNQELNNVALKLASAAVVAILLGIILAFWFSKSLTRPLARLAQTVKEFGDGNWDKRVSLQREDEFGQLASAFNSMASHMETARQQEKEYEKTLVAALQKAEAGEKAKSEFLATMSHEMRTPLTAILGFTQRFNLTNPEEKKLQQTVLNNGRHLLKIINDVLDLTKIEVEAMVIEHIHCEPVSLIKSVVATMEQQVQVKGLCLNVHYQYPVPKTILTDPHRLQQIILNLTGNAVKYTEQGSIEINLCYLASNELQIAIKDTGIGIPAEQQSRLFKAFSQADSSNTRIHGGTGLGLYISAELCKLMGGAISFNNEYGHGSEFIIRIPCGDPAKVELIDSAEQLARLESSPLVESSDSKSRLSGSILLAEDWPDNQTLITCLVEDVGVEICIADNGKLAVEQALSNDYDLILMDIHMPEMDGLDATRLLRSLGYSKPIIALTANVMQDQISSYQQAGFSDYVAKPIDLTNFYQTLEKYLPKSEQVKQEAPPNSKLEQQMEKLKQSFHQGLPEILRELEQAKQEMDIENLLRLAHNLKGTAKTFGFPLITDIAADIDKSLKQGEIDKGLSIYPQLISALEEAQKTNDTVN